MVGSVIDPSFDLKFLRSGPIGTGTEAQGGW